MPRELKLSDSRHRMIEHILNPDHVAEMTLEEKMQSNMKDQEMENNDQGDGTSRSSRAIMRLSKA